MKKFAKALKSPPIACALISLLVLSAVIGMRRAGWLQRPELTAYDYFVRKRSKPASTDPRIVLVGMTEEDLTKYGYPLEDEKLAKVITALDQREPCVIGLDLYRDLKEPRSGEHYPELEAALKKATRVMAIERLGYFAPPPALKNEPDRIVANNLARDNSVDGYFRRGTLTFEQGTEDPLPSLSLGLVLKYLDQQNVAYGFEGKDNLLRLGKMLFPRLTPTAGGYVNLPVQDYQYLAAYEAPRRFRNNFEKGAADVSYDWSFGDVLEGRIPADALRGKIVFVATVMASIKDSNPTPIDNDLRGVHSHIMLAHQLLEAALEGKPPMNWWPEWANVLWIAGFTAGGGLLSLFLRSPWKLAPALLGTLGVLGASTWMSFLHGTWLLLAAPAIGCFVTATFVTSFIAYLERSERDTMQNLFARHVSADVVETLWENRDNFLEGGRLKPQRLTCTVLFTDLKGFSTISEGMEPADLMNWMNEYMDAVARHVDLHDGVVNTYIGDAIMALFGAPVPHESEEERDRDAINAVHCALAMRGEMEKLNEGWTARGMPNVGMRVGIYTGPLVAGSLGSADRLMFTVLGDTTNTAARLEGAGKELAEDEYNKLCTILIGDATLQRLHGHFETKLVGPMSLKGKAQQIIVHSVLYAKTPRLSQPAPALATA